MAALSDSYTPSIHQNATVSTADSNARLRVGNRSFPGDVSAGSFNGFGSYMALLAQAGTAAPTATILGTNLRGTPVWTRTSIGVYVCTLTGEFTAAKTFAKIQAGLGFVSIAYTSADAITLTVYDSGGALADPAWTAAAFQILIAP